jgi:hypothetical protein
MMRKLIDRIRKGPVYRYKSAEDGRFVSKLYAMLHPETTYRTRVR